MEPTTAMLMTFRVLHFVNPGYGYTAVPTGKLYTGTHAERSAILSLHGTDLGAVWDGHEFQTSPLYVPENPNHRHYLMHQASASAHPYGMNEHLFYPIDPRIEAIDVDGAVRAYRNNTNDGWLFEHTNEGQHHDHFLRAEDCAIVRFQPAIDGLDIKEREATNGPAKQAALARYKNLVAFRDAVATAIVAAEKTEHLGHFVQVDPEVGHVHDAVRQAIRATKAKWAESTTDLARYRTIAGFVTPITRTLSTPHKPETRWDKAARLAAEAKRKADADAAARQPPDGGQGD